VRAIPSTAETEKEKRVTSARLSRGRRRGNVPAFLLASHSRFNLLLSGAMIYFEDLEIGRETRFGSYEVTREEVLDFARKYDPQPFHLSDEAAAKTHFGRLAASGWHTCAMAMAVIARAVVAEEQAGLGSPGIDELRWLKPVYPGDTLTVVGRIIDKTPSRSRPDIGSFRTETIVTNQHEEPVMRMTSIVLIRRRPAP
jgi:acyl dehydratase